MKITYIGHSSFLLESSGGTRILTDPFDNTTGYKVFREKVNVVTISHHHFDHDYTSELTCENIIDKTGCFNFKDTSILGIPSYHDKAKGAKRGKNIIFIIELDGYRVCHLGDLGHLLSDEQLSKLKNIDVLFIPVGGNFTIDGKEAAKVAKSINPHLIIPMHYKTELLSFQLDGLETFLRNIKNSENTGTNSIQLDKSLKEFNKVKILNYSI